MSSFMIDIECDGPIPGDYSMISFGAVLIDETLATTFYGQLKPISDKYSEEALAISGHTREESMHFRDAKSVMAEFAHWITKHSDGHPKFFSDNNGFDFAFMNWYFHHFLGDNPFGFSSANIGSLYKGLVKDYNQNFKHLKITPHTHHPVDDAKGNAEALLYMIKEMGLQLDL